MYIDDSFVWRLCEFTVWRCMTGAYFGVYSIYKSFRSKVNFVVCQCLIIVIKHEIDWDRWFWSACVDWMTLNFSKLVSLPFIRLYLCLISVCDDRVWHGTRWCCRWICGELLRLSDAERDSVYFEKFAYDFVNIWLRFQFNMNMYFDTYYL